MKKILTGLAAALSISACANYQVADTGEAIPQTAIAPYSEWPTDLEGRTLEIRSQTGWTSVANLAPDGTLRIVPELGTHVIKGTWGEKGDALCVNYAPRGEECWAYKEVVAANGGYVDLLSDRGQQLRVRLMTENDEALVSRR
jgi:hypothetical protein